MRMPLQRLALLVLGWFLIGLGIVGLFLPILQGVLLLVAGLWVLSLESRTVRRLLERLRARYPRIAEVEERAKERLSSWGARVRRRRESPVDPETRDD